MLEGLGLNVSVRSGPTCTDPIGRALRTDPSVGAPLEPGGSITLLVSTAASSDFCIDDQQGHPLAWQLIDFASGRGPAPDFADNVVVVANGVRATISGIDAAQVENWVDGTPLGVLRQKSREVQSARGGRVTSYSMPGLAVEPSELGAHCGGYSLSGLDPSQGIQLRVEFRSDFVSLICTSVDVLRSNGAITAIVLRTDSLATQPDDTRVLAPDVVGLSTEKAQTVLEAKGFAYEEHIAVRFPGHFCMKNYRVISQEPSAGSFLLTGGVVHVETSWGDCGGNVQQPHSNPEGLARLFTLFASMANDSGQGLLIENPVRLYLGNKYVRTLSGEDASDPDAWNVCEQPGYAERSCPISATLELHGGLDAQQWSPAAGASVCPVEVTTPPTDTGGVLEVVITPKTTSACLEYYEVQLFTDGGQVVAVNLLLGSP